jgi:hypothetical protein
LNRGGLLGVCDTLGEVDVVVDGDTFSGAIALRRVEVEGFATLVLLFNKDTLLGEKLGDERMKVTRSKSGQVLAVRTNVSYAYFGEPKATIKRYSSLANSDFAKRPQSLWDQHALESCCRILLSDEAG